ncbi:MAG: RES domain-containing protein [Candidatus Baltobacteraceae bacterium]
MKTYRVFPYLQGAANEFPGGALFIPTTTEGRISNPELYATRYMSNSAEGAIAETFGRYPVWLSGFFLAPVLPIWPGSRYALATYELDDTLELCDLDDAQTLLTRNLRPSEVVVRDLEITQRWARGIFEERAWAGITWWSYYDPAWKSAGVWASHGVRLIGKPEILDLSHPKVKSTAAIIVRHLG